MADEKKPFTVTGISGERPLVAGVRTRAGATVHLTETEAKHELSRKVVVEGADVKLGKDGMPVADKPAKKTEPKD